MTKTQAPDEPRRLTPTERLHEVTMAAIQRHPSEPEHSITLSRNARGIVQPEIVVRGPVLDDVLAHAVETFDFLCDRYPYPNGNGPE